MWIIIAFVGVFASLILLLMIRNTIRDIFKSFQRKEKITPQRRNPQDQILKLLSRSIELYGRDSITIAGHRQVRGMSAAAWSDTIKRMRAAGCGIYTQRGEGTKLTRDNLRIWYQHFRPNHSPTQATTQTEPQFNA
ncbi:MAG: hypothetical protein ACYTFW_05145 [Planctomycetota bacterium]